MKITKETLIQLIKEELAELQEQRIDREAEADADVRQSIKRGIGRAGKSLAGKLASYDPRTAQKKRAAGYKSMADKKLDDPRARMRAKEDRLKMGISATLANMPDADQKKWLADYGDLPIRQQAYKLGLLENRVPNADMLEEIIFEEFEAALSERVDPVKLAKDRADKQCAKHGEGSDQCKKFRKRHKDAERSARKK